MSPLDDLPNVESFFGVDLRTGSLIVAVIGVEGMIVLMTTSTTPSPTTTTDQPDQL
ncbi:hypothetical protein HF086_003519, partial [Spodoptera exigua]